MMISQGSDSRSFVKYISAILNRTNNTTVFWISLFYLLIYSAVVLIFQDRNLIGDENRYLVHANCLWNLQFTPDDKDMWLWNGPGYPMMLMPFVLFFKDPVTPIRLLNALLLSSSLIIFYHALRFVVSKSVAFVAFIAFANYFILWKNLPLIMTEIPIVFLSCLIIYYLFKKVKGKYDILILALLFAFTVMVKIVYGYIITISIFFFFLYYFVIKRDTYFLQMAKMFALALLFCLPWLSYTYYKSGKIFYWAASGGMSLYWMSNPAPDEYGEYMDYSFNSAIGVPEAKIGFEKTHGEEIRAIVKNFKYEKRDEEFKRVAMENIKAKPQAFVKNVFCNIGRFFFNYPYSYYKQRPSTLVNILVNGPLLSLILLSTLILLLNLRQTYSPLIVILVVAFGYMAINFLLSVHIRMSYVLIPTLFAWFAIYLEDIRAKYSFYNRNKSVS